jgi:hypothetical protein
LIPQPTWTIEDVKKNGAQALIALRQEYEQKLRDQFTVDVREEHRTYVDKNDTYYYEKVEVR